MGCTSNLLTELPTHIENTLAALGYPGLFVLMVLENLFPPLPSEMILPLTGFLITLDRMDIAWVLTASVGGSLIGALILYALGRALGEARLKSLLRRYGRYVGLTEAAYDRGAAVLLHRSGSVLFWGRFVPGVRSVISLPAGVVGVPMRQFLAWTFLGSLCWNGVLIGAGMVLAENWIRVLALMDNYELALLWALGALGVGFAVVQLIRRLFAWRSSARA